MRLSRIQQTPSPQDEPIGIVIADGGRSDTSTRFSAFVWGPVPVELDERVDTLVLAAAG